MTAETQSTQIDALQPTDFERCQKAFFSYCFSDQFREQLIANNIPEDDEFVSEAFWEIAAYNVPYWFNSPEAAEYSDSEMNLINYLAKLPVAVCINARTQHPNRDEKLLLSDSNAAMRNLVRCYPGSSIEDILGNSVTFLRQQLRGTIDKTQLGHVDEIVRTQIRGVKAELALEQILGTLGIEFREGTAEEDLRGCDYIVGMTDGTRLEIDVKASSSQLESKLKQGSTLKELYSVATDKHTGTKKVTLVPFVPESGFEKRGVEHLFLIDPDIMLTSADTMDKALFAKARRVA